MRNSIIRFGLIVPTFLFALVVLIPAALTGQSQDPDRITVPLSDPSKPAYLKVGLINGSIHVKGYSGKDVIVDSRPGDDDDGDRDEHDHDDDADDERASKRKGMRKITNTSGGITVEEEDNEVKISEGWRGMGDNISITIQVPAASDVKLSTINDGTITVSGVTGDIEVSNMNGPISLTEVSGSVVADAMNDDISVKFSSIDQNKTSSVTSMNGDIDVTLPASAKATLRLKNDQGEIYSDFDMKVENVTDKKQNENKKGGRYKVTVEQVMKGSINGGGNEMTIKNFNGDIYIRKGK